MDENIIVALERDRVVTATFRKLEPSKKDVIYRAALRVLAADIFERVTIDDIAAEAGVSKGSLVQYFVHKENLSYFVAEVFLDEYRQYWESYFGRETAVRIRERLDRFLRARLDFWDREKTNFRFYMKMHYENARELSDRFRRSVERLRWEYVSRIVVRGTETGEIRRDVGPENMVFLIMAIIRNMELAFLSTLGSPKGKAALENQVDAVITLLFDGIEK
jgi:AcrR family transcriptional regulator